MDILNYLLNNKNKKQIVLAFPCFDMSAKKIHKPPQQQNTVTAMPRSSPAITLDKTINHEKFIQHILLFLLHVNNPQIKRRPARVTTVMIKSFGRNTNACASGYVLTSS